MNVKVTIGDNVFEVEVEDAQARPVIARIGAERFEVWPEAAAAGGPPASVPAPVGGVRPSNPSSNAVLSPLPGVVLSVAVQPGSRVTLNQELCVLEAMKMNTAIRAPRAGCVAAVLVSAGQTVRHKQPLVSYEPE
ncbi:MAG: biotin/lipoyl-containing protein [Anaerolineales bacterium]